MKLLKTVSLKFFEDDADGEWGVAPTYTVDNMRDTEFNAFWSSTGLFHDVFEHSHEGSKYFRGENAFNIGGEMAAMGARLWFETELYLTPALAPNSIHTGTDRAIQTTFSLVEESITEGYGRYGDTLNSSVPYQRPHGDGELEWLISDYMSKVRKLSHRNEKSDLESLLRAKTFKDSVTFRKVADLYRWGYRKAEKLVPNTYPNRETLVSFISYWASLTKNNPAAEVAQTFQYLVFRLYRDIEDKLQWKATFVVPRFQDLPHVSNKVIRSTELTSFSLAP